MLVHFHKKETSSQQGGLIVMSWYGNQVSKKAEEKILIVLVYANLVIEQTKGQSCQLLITCGKLLK